MADEDPQGNWTNTDWVQASAIVENGLAVGLDDVIRLALKQRVVPDLLFLSVLYYVHEVFEDSEVPITSGVSLMVEAALRILAAARGEAAAEGLRARLAAAFRDS
jgi:hypothetical protein